MAGRGNRRKTCQTTMLIDWFLRAGETANESVVRKLMPSQELVSPNKLFV